MAKGAEASAEKVVKNIRRKTRQRPPLSSIGCQTGAARAVSGRAPAPQPPGSEGSSLAPREGEQAQLASKPPTRCLEGSFGGLPRASTHVHWCIRCKDLGRREIPPACPDVRRRPPPL